MAYLLTPGYLSEYNGVTVIFISSPDHLEQNRHPLLIMPKF